MLTVILFAAAIGVILGSSCRILVLGPATLLASSATLAAGFVSNANFITITCVLLAVLATLQIGYVLGGIAGAYLRMRTNVLRSTIRPSRYY
jgi:hypothetical protein